MIIVHYVRVLLEQTVVVVVAGLAVAKLAAAYVKRLVERQSLKEAATPNLEDMIQRQQRARL